MEKEIFSGKKCNKTLEYLLKRRSCSLKLISDPGPTETELETILTASSRVPDHGRLFPWHFMVFEGDARQQVGEILKQAWLEEDSNAPEAKLELEAQRFMRAPLVIGVVSRIRRGKHPAWEQILSAGAVCQNLILTANALGYSTNWLTEWYSRNDTFRNKMGLDAHDHIAGFIYIGTAQNTPEERDRPDLDKIVTHWQPNIMLNKGDCYDKENMDYPKSGL